MATFAYQAITEGGSTISGTIEAESVGMAENMLINDGFMPTRVAAGGSTISLQRRIENMLTPVAPRDLILFTKQFRSMLHAGIPIMRIFQVLEAQTENVKLKQVIAEISEDIKHGSTLFNALEKHPKVFSSLYRSMVRAGELSGSLPDVLLRLIYIIEHETKIKSDIKSALQYPKMVVMALGVAFFVLLTFVIPKFVAMFTKVGIEIPWPTQMALLMYTFIQHSWYILIGAVAAVILGVRAYVRTEQGRLVKDTFLLRLPIFGPLFTKAALSRFASIFAILHSSGIQVMTSITVLSETIGNFAISKELDRVRGQMEQGQGISGPLSRAKYFTPMVVDMVAIGEESGNIEEMLREITNHYDDEVSYAVRSLSEALGPILIVGLAAVVGFFALAIFLPMWDMTKMIKH